MSKRKTHPIRCNEITWERFKRDAQRKNIYIGELFEKLISSEEYANFKKDLK